jgi:hypothetical protein
MSPALHTLLRGIVCLAVIFHYQTGMAQGSDCYTVGNQLVCPSDQASGSGDDVSAGTSDYGDDVYPGKPDGTGEPPDTQPPSRDDDGKNWLLPAIVVGVAALAAVNHHLNKEREQQARDDEQGTRQLLRDGPQLPMQFNKSAFGVRGLLRGGWPIVVDYEQRVAGKVQLRISIPGSEIVTYRLDQFGLGRHVLQFRLPTFLGDGLKPALIALTAVDPQSPGQTLEGFTVYGVGIGPRAVGSVAVDRLEFAPGTVSVSEGQTAGYGFHSQSTFDNAAVEFMRVTQTPDGVRTAYVNGKRIPGGVRQDAWVESDPGERWNGYDFENRVSEGRHQLQVRVWDDGGDWVGAWSNSLVTVQ